MPSSVCCQHLSRKRCTIAKKRTNKRRKGETACTEVAVAAALAPAPPPVSWLAPSPAPPLVEDSTFWCNQSVGQGLLCYVPLALAAGAATVGVVKAANNDLAVFEQQ